MDYRSFCPEGDDIILNIKENRHSSFVGECLRGWKAYDWNSQHFVTFVFSSIAVIPAALSVVQIALKSIRTLLLGIPVRIPGFRPTSITLQFILSLAYDKQRKDLYLNFACEITRYKIGRVLLAGWNFQIIFSCKSTIITIRCVFEIINFNSKVPFVLVFTSVFIVTSISKRLVQWL